MGARNSIPTAGYSLVEVLIAVGLSSILMGSGALVFQQGVLVNSAISEHTEMQQSARAALNLIARDLSIAGTGVAEGGIALPSGSGSGAPLFGCDSADCYITDNDYADDNIYAITPGDGIGPTVNGAVTDVVTLVYEDNTVNLNEFPLTNVTTSGSQITFDPATNPPIEDVIANGDMLVLCNINGCAAGVVTGIQVAQQRALFANNDPLNVNQPSASFGNIASILDPPSGPTFPPTWVIRVQTITYYIEVPPGLDGTVGTADDGDPRLMFQVNAQSPVPVADGVENLQFSYDVYDDAAEAATANLSGAGGLPNQIRKVNISLTVRSSTAGVFGTGFERMTLSTSVSPRNLSFRDRYD